MKIACRIALLMGLGFGLMAWPHFAAAQTCKDEQSMWDESKKDLSQLVTTVKQESLPDFEKAYHQKSVLNKLTFFGSAVQELLACLEKAEQDPASSKEIVAASKAQHEIYAKLQAKVQHDVDTLKSLTAPKDAKVYAGKLDEAM
jgi:hypothetical protein